MIRSLIPSGFLINLSFAFLLMFFIVSVLFIFSLLGKINSQPNPRSVSSWVILTFIRVIYVILDINRYFISTNVTFFEDSSFSSTTCPTVSDVLSIPLVLPSPDFSSPPPDVVTRPLLVYTSRSRPPTTPLPDSSSKSSSSPALVPQPPDDLPISIQKGTRSTCNTHPVYNFLRFHRLSLSYFAFVSTLSLPLKALVRLSLIQSGNRQWMRKWMLFTPMAHGNLPLFLLASLPLVVIEFIQ